MVGSAGWLGRPGGWVGRVVRSAGWLGPTSRFPLIVVMQTTPSKRVHRSGTPTPRAPPREAQSTKTVFTAAECAEHPHRAHRRGMRRAPTARSPQRDAQRPSKLQQVAWRRRRMACTARCLRAPVGSSAYVWGATPTPPRRPRHADPATPTPPRRPSHANSATPTPPRHADPATPTSPHRAY